MYQVAEAGLLCASVYIYSNNVVPWIGLWAVIVAFPGRSISI